MPITIAIVSILLGTGIMRFVNSRFPVRICPICAGISGTWLWILTGMYTGFLDPGSWNLIAALGLGGSAVGIAYAADNRFPQKSTPLFWRITLIPLGFAIAYALLTIRPRLSVLVLVFLAEAVIIYLFSELNTRVVSEEEKLRNKKLEEKMRDCC